MHTASARGAVLSWDDLKREFLSLVGAHYSRSSQDALSVLAHNMVRQTNKQSVTDYRLAFDAKLCGVGHPLPDTLLVQWFVQELSADLHAHCVVDFSGHPHATLNAAVDFARGAEQRLQAMKGSNGKRWSTTPVAALHSQLGRGQKHAQRQEQEGH
jgi:hypothetical protein